MIETACHNQAVICAGDRCGALQSLLVRWKVRRQMEDAQHQVEMILGNQHPMLIAKPHLDMQHSQSRISIFLETSFPKADCNVTVIISNLSNDSSKASSKTIPLHSAI